MAELEPAYRAAAFDNLAEFFSDLVDMISEHGEMETTEVWDSAVGHGLALRVPFDPDVHGEIEGDPEEGDMIYWLSPLANHVIGRANDLRRAREEKAGG